MRRLKESCIARRACLILTPILFILSGGLSDPAWAKQKIACDFLTGAGEVQAPAGNGTASFGLASGVAHGSFWGHLTYVDSGSMLTVENTGIVNYQSRGRSTRVIEGTARTNLYGDRHYRVTATDASEPGRNDTFQIELDNGYVAQGALLKGSVVILEGNLNSLPPAGSACDKLTDSTPGG
jgi:hypothetical protein